MKYRFKGLKSYVSKLESVASAAMTNLMIEDAITAGAQVVKDITMKELEHLPVDNRPYVQGKRTSIMQVQKTALINAFGTSDFQTKRSRTDKKTGVRRGLNKLEQPHVVIARRLENGTSYMKKNPVFTRASRKARTPCLEAMQESLNKAYDRLTK